MTTELNEGPATNGKPGDGQGPSRGNKNKGSTFKSALAVGVANARVTVREARNWSELRRSPYGLTPVLALSTLGLFFAFNGAIAGVSTKQILQSFVDLDLVKYGQYQSFIGFVGIFGTIGVAYVADRRRRLPLIAAGLFIAGVSFGMQSVSTGNFGFMGSGTLILAALTVAGVPTNSILADYYPPEVRGKVFALLGLFGTLGSTFLPLIAGFLVQSAGWRPVYGLSGVPIALMAIFIMVRLREPVRGYFERRAMGASEDVAVHEEEPPSFGEAWRTTWNIRTLRRLAIGGGFVALGGRFYSYFSGIFFFEHYRLSEFEIGLLQTAGAVCFAVPGTYLAGGFVDLLMRRRPSQVLTAYGLFSLSQIFSIVLFVLAPPIPVLFVVSGVFDFGAAILGPAISVLYLQIVPAQIRTLGGAVDNLSRIPALMFFGILIGPVVTNMGVRGGMVVGIPFIFIGLCIYLSAAGLFEFDMRSAFAANMASEEWRRAKETGTGKLLVCRDIDVHYDGVQVLFGVDFDVEEGQIIALLGTNGAGKSTLLRAIAGSSVASSGAVVFDGRDTTYMPPHETAARGIIFMPGGRGVFPALSVRENLLLGNWMTDDNDEVKVRLAEVFDIFPILKERASEPAVNLSGGEQQMLSLAQAFLCKPRLLMIDELSLGLSPAVVGQLIEIVRRIHASGVTIIVVEQSVNVALTIAEKAIFMEKGEVRFFGNTADLLARPDILRAVYVKGTGALTEGAPAGAQGNRRAYELEQARPVLEVEGIVKRFGGITAINGVSFSLRESEVLGIIGPNGSGKTTLFEIISGFQTADEGIVRYEGVDITTLSPEERARRKLVRRFQDARLFPSLTVFETLLLALDQRLEVRSTLLNGMGMPQARRAEKRVRLRAERLVELLELGAFRDKFVKELSTGLRRIVDLACVLATEPKVLLLDEPSSGIAQAEAEGLAPLLKRVRFETGCSILIIEHDMPLISAVSDELLALERGTFLTRGLPEEVLNDERVIESYLGGTEATVKRSGSMV